MEIQFGNFVWKFCLDVCLDISFGNLSRKYRLEVSFGNFVWKYCLDVCLEVSFGNFVWKTDRPTDRPTNRPTERLLEAPSRSLKTKRRPITS